MASASVATLAAAVLSVGSWAAAAERVHFSDFNDAANVSDAWSTKSTAVPPADDGTNGRPAKRHPRRYLGEFTNETVTLSLKSLPPHAFVRISFDLLILKSWEGISGATIDNQSGGPEYWGMQLDQGPLLIHAAFANPFSSIGLQQEGPWQTFPTLIPGERVPARTRAAETNSFGFEREAGGDSTYRLKLLLPHQGPNVKFGFFGENLQQVEDHSWALDNVTVEVLSAEEVPPLSPAEWKNVWDDFGDANPAKAFDAGWKLVAAPAQTIEKSTAFLAALGRLPDKELLAKKTAGLVKQLDANEFRARERAMKDLLKLGSSAIPYLRRAWKAPASAEARSRLELLLGRIDDIDPAYLDEDTRRRERLSVVLGIINTPPTTKLLEKYYPDR
ncbi:MAG TPA: hypothetical protein VFE24_00120 [Pirellulales bacterium]|nr:hypothetical protein [Pirellulales bacterium]